MGYLSNRMGRRSMLALGILLIILSDLILIPIRNQRADKIHSHPVIDLTMEELFS